MSASDVYCHSPTKRSLVVNYSLPVCGYIWKYDGGRHDEDGRDDCHEVGCAAYLV